jgi:hypothetical protein
MMAFSFFQSPQWKNVVKMAENVKEVDKCSERQIESLIYKQA